MWAWGENNGRIRNWGMSLVRNTLGVKGCAKALQCGLRRMTYRSVIHMYLHKLNNMLVNAWLEHFLCTDEPWASTNSQDSSQLELGEDIIFFFIVFFMLGHGVNIQMSFCFVTPKLKSWNFWNFWNWGSSFDHNLCFKYPNGSCKPPYTFTSPRFGCNKHCIIISFLWIRLMCIVQISSCN